MPSARVPPRAPGALSGALLRILRTGIVAGFALFALALLAVRFVVFPYVESYRERLASALAQQIGHPVEIGALTTGWDGWNPKLVVSGLRVRDSALSTALPLIELPEVVLVVGWTSLPLLELRLKELVVDRPRLAVRRDRSGVVHVAGIEIDPARADEGLPVTDWLLRQREIVVRDALITWDDDQRNAPQLILDRVQFRLENGFGRHRFGLKGTPPAELAAPLDLRGDLTVASAKDWQAAEGTLFVRLDYADVAAWREWLPLPAQIANGKGALRVWFEFARGEVREVVADLELADVKARLGEQLPELDLAHVSGRVGWRGGADRREVFARNLAFVTMRGDRHDPANFSFALRGDANERASSGQIEFDRLQLEPLVALGAHLPLSADIRTDLARFSPRGTLTHGRLRWEGPAESPAAFSASGEFSQLGVLAQGELPGATGITGRFDVAQDRGEIRLGSNRAVVEMPRLFRVPLEFDTLRADVKWERREGMTTVRLEQIDFANADAAGSASGTLRLAVQGPGEVDIVARTTRADASQVHRYLPVTVDDALREWLRTSLKRGDVADARLKLAGNLAEFPFAAGKGGQFLVTAKAKGGTLDFADAWPPIDGIDAEFRLEGTRLTIDAARAQAFGVAIGRTRAEIADVAAARPMLRIAGEAAGPAAGFLRYVNGSPVAALAGNFTRDMDASGSGRLALRLGLPLGRLEETTVAGEFTFADAQLRVPGVPPLTKVNGSVAFDEHEIRGRDIAADVMGGASRLAIAGTGGTMRVTGAGTVNIAGLHREHPGVLLDRVSGTVDWSIAVDARPGAVAWVLESPLKGAIVDLPAPLGKNAADTVALRIERRADPAQAGTDTITATYGTIAQLAAHRQSGPAGAVVDRAHLSLGRAAERPDAARAERPGLWVHAELPSLDVDDWLALLKPGASAEAGRPADGPAFAGADLDVGLLEALGVTFTDQRVRLRAGPGANWMLDLDGRDVAGTATWSGPGAGAPNGRLVARLARLALPARQTATSWRSADSREWPRESKPDAAANNAWPAIDVAADTLTSKGRDLGRLELVASPSGSDWRIDRLVLVNDNGRVEAEGAWRALARPEQTKLDVVLNAKDAGAFLTRFGHAEAVQGAPTKIDGQLAWQGAPHEFDFPSLSGSLRVEVGPGRFTKIEPGPGKLLGVLSLQALPRRATLDFRDVFSDGFSFDEVKGSVRIANGVMSTADLRLLGPAAKVDIAGDADLVRETQQLSVRVQPALSSSVSAGAALLFIANPLIGAAIGAGSLLAQAVMQDPIEQIFTSEFTVTGSWTDPVVTRSAGAGAKVSVGPGATQPPAGGQR